MPLRDQDMRSWLTKRSQEYLIEHIQYIGLLDEGKLPLADLPRRPIDWLNAELQVDQLVAPTVEWEVPPLFIPRFFGFFDRLVGGRLIDWWEAPNVLTQEDWVCGFSYRTEPMFTIR